MNELSLVINSFNFFFKLYLYISRNIYKTVLLIFGAGIQLKFTVCISEQTKVKLHHKFYLVAKQSIMQQTFVQRSVCSSFGNSKFSKEICFCSTSANVGCNQNVAHCNTKYQREKHLLKTKKTRLCTWVLFLVHPIRYHNFIYRTITNN